MKLKKALEERYKQVAILLIFIATIAVIITSITNKPETFPLVGYTINDNSIIEIIHKESRSKLVLEVASTPQKREKGLMLRNTLEQGSGMLFIFPTEQNLSFWMKDTSISLDIIFLNKDLKVTSVLSNTKILQTSEIYSSRTPSMYAIEVLAGWAFQNNLKTGDQFEIASIK